MNTVEHIVESYFRLCRRCFTYTDVKVHRGNNRQVDLLAVSLESGEVAQQYHIECSVVPHKQWWRSCEELKADFDKKFLGIPPKRSGLRTDSGRGKTYGGNIRVTHQLLGFDLRKTMNWVWICWAVKDPENLPRLYTDYHLQKGIKTEVISFRDAILPGLMETVSTANYDDEALRTFSLIKEWKQQLQKPMTEGPGRLCCHE
jgi:hypothetical protein